MDISEADWRLLVKDSQKLSGMKLADFKKLPASEIASVLSELHSEQQVELREHYGVNLKREEQKLQYCVQCSQVRALWQYDCWGQHGICQSCKLKDPSPETNGPNCCPQCNHLQDQPTDPATASPALLRKAPGNFTVLKSNLELDTLLGSNWGGEQTKMFLRLWQCMEQYQRLIPMFQTQENREKGLVLAGNAILLGSTMWVRIFKTLYQAPLVSDDDTASASATAHAVLRFIDISGYYFNAASALCDSIRSCTLTAISNLQHFFSAEHDAVTKTIYQLTAELQTAQSKGKGPLVRFFPAPASDATGNGDGYFADLQHYFHVSKASAPDNGDNEGRGPLSHAALCVLAKWLEFFTLLVQGGRPGLREAGVDELFQLHSTLGQYWKTWEAGPAKYNPYMATADSQGEDEVEEESSCAVM